MKTLLLSASLLLCTYASAFAQTAGPTNDDTATGATEVTVQNYVAAAITINADTLIGKPVRIGRDTALKDATCKTGARADVSGDWDEVGEVSDVLVAKDGQVHSVIIDAGGYLGLGERRVQLPVKSLQFVRDGGTQADYFVVYLGSRLMLENTPVFDEGTAQTKGSLPLGQGVTPDRAAAGSAHSTTGGGVGPDDAPNGAGTESVATNKPVCRWHGLA